MAQIYKIEYSGIAYVEADSKQEAEEKWENDDIIADSTCAEDITESSIEDASSDFFGC